MAAKQWPPISEDELREVVEEAGSKQAAAARLRISRPALDRWLAHYQIKVSRVSRPLKTV